MMAELSRSSKDGACGRSTSASDGTLVGWGAAATVHGTGTACPVSRESRLDAGVVFATAKGKHVSSKTTWRDMMIRRVERSRQ